MHRLARFEQLAIGLEPKQETKQQLRRQQLEFVRFHLTGRKRHQTR